MSNQQLLQEVIRRHLNSEIDEWNYIEIKGHRFAVKVITG